MCVCVHVGGAGHLGEPVFFFFSAFPAAVCHECAVRIECFPAES